MLRAKYRHTAQQESDKQYHLGVHMLRFSEGTRDFEEILYELRFYFELHRSHGSWRGGVHYELTGENVTECTGGAQKIAEKARYQLRNLLRRAPKLRAKFGNGVSNC